MKHPYKLVGLGTLCLLLLATRVFIDHRGQRAASNQDSQEARTEAASPTTIRPISAVARVATDRQSNPLAPVLELPALDHQALIAKANKLEQAGRYRFATARRVDARPATHGRWIPIADGRSRWELDVHSEGADSINLAFGEFRLPPGALLHLGAADSDPSFTFTDADNDDHGQLWTPIIVSDSISLRLEVDDALAPDMLLALSSVNHGFRGFQDRRSKDGKIGSDSSGACNIDVVCSAADNSVFGPLIDMYRDQIRSVGAYTVYGIDTCSGALINNTANNVRPLFLTANHCEIFPEDAPSVVVYWNFENTTCRPAGSSSSGTNGNGPLTQFNSGSIYRSGNAATDFTLIELDDPVNPNAIPFFAGWNRTSANPSASVTVHHPAVSEKRISFDLNPATTTSAYENPSPGDGNYIRVIDWDFGTTEGGSSGAPLFDDSGYIIGQLLGGDAACGNDLSDWYGRLSRSWTGGGQDYSRLSNWLDPIGTGAITLEGINADQLIRVASRSVTEGDSGSHDVALTVTLTPATSETVTVRLATAPGSPNPATPGEDYLPVDTLLTFAPGEVEKTVNITILTDTTPEENETISIVLSDPSNAIISSAPTTIIILNDEYSEPIITSDLSIQAPTQSILRYRITALGTPTNYTLTAAPAGMTIDPMTGEITWITPAPGNYSAIIGTSNPVGSDSETLLIEILGNNLANALDLDSSIPLSTSAFPWVLQTLETHDNFDAGRSGMITHSETSRFTINVTGPDAIRFFWKVSSERSYDFLTVTVADPNAGTAEEIGAISGEVDWTEVIVPIPAGPHTVTWAYTKDSSYSEGADIGWVDEINLASISGDPLIISPTQLSITLGDPFTYVIESIDPAATFTASKLPPGLSFDGGNTISGTPSASGTYDIPLSASNGQTSEVTLSLTIVQPVGPSIEQPNLAWVPTGDQFWFPQSSQSFMGASAARSGSIADEQSSTLNLEVTGPDWIAFWWKVSSEEGYDFLRFDYDGAIQREISGEVDWHRVAMSIPSGTHTLSWTYEKDVSENDGADAGYLDNVILASSSPLPFITSPDSTVAFQGQPFGYQITAVNAPQTFGANNLPSGLTLDPVTGLISGQPSQAGRQTFTVWADNVFGRGQLELTINRATLDTAIPPAIDQPLLPVSNSSTQKWRVSGTRKHAGVSSAASPAMFDNNSSEMSAYVTGPGTVVFYWSVSSQPERDTLSFLFDRVPSGTISGEVDWTEVSVNIPSGQHELTWIYAKDNSGAAGLDTGWVDDIRLSGYTAFANSSKLRLGDALPGADPDGDRYANLLEFVFATGPDDANETPAITVTETPATVELTFKGNSELGDVSVTLERSADLLSPWTDSGIEPEITPDGRFRQDYRFTIPTTGAGASGAGYFRIKASTAGQ